MKKLLSIVLSAIIACSMFAITKANTTSQTISNPNPELEQISSIDAIRNSLKLVWNDEFGGEIGCGAPKKALPTTNGFDEEGNPTSDEVRASAKWAHERYRDGTPKNRNGQLQHYVGVDGRNSWTEDGVLYLRGQREENGYVDPITKQTYHWTADGLRSSYFDSENGIANLQAFRFGMMEARVYTVNGKALIDENGNPVLDKDGNIMQDPKYSQGLWNGFWTTGNPDMSEENAYIRNKSEKSTWPYCGEIDICEAYTSPSAYSTYNSSTGKTNIDSYGIIITASQYIVKYDENGKILITDKSGNALVKYDNDSSSYVVTEGQEEKYTVSGEEITIVSKSHIVRQDENGKIYISDAKDKTIVDTEGNCYGSSTLATSQLHYRTGERFDGTLVSGVTVKNEKTTGAGGGYKVSQGTAGQAMMGDTGYHTYGVYWTPTQLVYYYDDLIIGYHDITDPQFFQLRECPQYMFLTFPIGGSVPGDPNPALDYADYMVDYVRIYQADDGYNTDENYQGAYGFPELNDLDQPVSYYDEITNAYSGIKIMDIYNSCEFSNSAEKFVSWAAPFRTNGKLCSIKTKGTIKTIEKQPEGKYDVYISGVARQNSKDFKFSINGVSVDTRLNLSDYYKDDFGREYLNTRSTYIGTVDIVNGAHNIQIDAQQVNSLYGDGSQPGRLYSIVLVKNEKSTTTVTIDSDTPVTTTANGTTVTQPTSQPQTDGVYKWNLYTDNFTYNADHTMNNASNGKPFLNTHYANDGTYFFSSNNAVGNSVTLTSIATVKPGIYSAKLFARVTGARALIDISINDVKVATNLNTGNKGENAFPNTSYDGYNIPINLTENTIKIDKPTQIDIKFVVTNVSSPYSGNLYLNAIELTKIADINAISTLEEASIRLNDKTGIRFYTSVDSEIINTYKNDGYTVEMGTLIAPDDLVEDELTFDTEKFIDVKYESDKLYQDSDFSGIVGSIVNIKEHNIGRNFVGRGYLKLTKDSKTTIIYSDSISTCSAKFIASKIQEFDNWEENYTQEHINLINKWANA
ncbi:MAG: family 16 glycosylhydrolase [Clostridia bacterium]|nr:family 16 glycosylhydrolase [Clostridia bacterium]